MDHKEFDALVASLANAASRRETVKGLIAGTLGAAGITAFEEDDAEAKRKGRHGKRRGNNRGHHRGRGNDAGDEKKKKKKKRKKKCKGGTTKCGGTKKRPICVDLSTDESNCGACFNVCTGTQVCANGVCTPVT